MAARVDPVAPARVLVGDDDRQPAVVERRGVLVDRDPALVVERLHPPVVELEVPVGAVRHLGLDDPGLPGLERPVAVQVEDLGIAAGLLEHLLAEVGHLVGPGHEHLGPAREQRRGAVQRERSRRERLGQVRRVELLALDRVTDAFDVPLAGHLGRTVEVRLADHEAGRVRRERQPVLVVRRGARDDLDGAVGLHHEVAIGDLAGRGHGAVDRIAVGLGADAEVGDRAARAGDPVRPVAADVGRQVDVVGVVRAELDPVELVQPREVGVGVLDRRVEHLPQQARQVAIALGPVERRVGRGVAQDDLARLLQRTAEIGPCLPGGHLPSQPRRPCHLHGEI